MRPKEGTSKFSCLAIVRVDDPPVEEDRSSSDSSPSEGKSSEEEELAPFRDRFAITTRCTITIRFPFLTTGVGTKASSAGDPASHPWFVLRCRHSALLLRYSLSHSVTTPFWSTKNCGHLYVGPSSLYETKMNL